MWHKLAFSVSWTRHGKVRILYFEVPNILQDAIIWPIKALDFTDPGPLDINNIIIEETVALFDK
jgi:hypothetical protein